MQPAAAWGRGGSLLGRQGGLSPFRGGPSQAAQPQGAGSTHACPLGTTQPSWVAAPPVGLPSPLNTTPHTYLPLIWDSAWQQWGPPHHPHLSHPPCLPEDTTRTKDCTHWQLGGVLLWGRLAALSSSPRQQRVPVPVPCHVPLCLSHTKGAAAAAHLFGFCLVWFVPVAVGVAGAHHGRGEPSPGKLLGTERPCGTAGAWGAAVGRGSSAPSATGLGQAGQGAVPGPLPSGTWRGHSTWVMVLVLFLALTPWHCCRNIWGGTEERLTQRAWQCLGVVQCCCCWDGSGVPWFSPALQGGVGGHSHCPFASLVPLPWPL